ncbi:MAG: PAS domain-containing protein, partial [Flavisolibacter sp.]
EPLFESTYRIKDKSGNFKWVLARGMIISRDSSGKPLRMIGTHTDITNQVIAEDNYKLLFYNNPLPMWTYDAATLKFKDVNDAAIRNYGYSREEFLSMTIKDIRPLEYLPDLMDALQNRISYKTYLETWSHQKKNGELIQCEISTYLLEKDNEKTILVLANDITEKLKAQNELIKSNTRFSYAAKAASEALWEWDIQAGTVYFSDAYTEILGWQISEKRTFEEWHDFIHPKERKEIIDGFYSSLKDPAIDIWTKEYRYKKSDGSYAHVLDKAFIIRSSNGNAIKVIGAMQDITERKYNEKLLSLERSIFELSTHPEIDFKTIVDSLLKGIEDIFYDSFTSVIILKDDGTIFPLSSTGLPESFFHSLKGLKPVKEGSCGTAICTKQTVISENIESDPLWKNCKDLPLQYGLKACWSLPIISSANNVFGTLAMYFKSVKSPTPIELNILERIRNILRIVMEHYWSLNEIKVAKERFDIMMKATHDLIWDWNIDTNTIYRNAIGLKKVYGVENNESIETIEKWLPHIHPQDLERVSKVLKEITSSFTQDTFDVEYRFKKDDGTYSHVYDRGIIVRDGSGKPIRMIGAAQDITERKHLEQELLKNELERQKAINQATVDTQENERSEIGKELHDNVNQVLTTTKLYLDLALSNPELKDELIQKSTKNIIGVINEIRQLSRSLMDPSIGDLGLIDSINDLIDNINLTRKLHVKLLADKKIETLLNKNQKLTVFRIIQEALNNAIKHAKASTVSIQFNVAIKYLEIVIEDDGVGFHPELIKKGAGLKNIQNRIYLINGSHSILSAPEQGCKILINFPIN